MSETNKEDEVFWDMAKVAAYLGVKPNTVHVYRTRAEKNRKRGEPAPGDLPPEDNTFGRTPVWKPETIKRWAASKRPGQGVGGGRPPRSG